jgi:hypothetical protein
MELPRHIRVSVQDAGLGKMCGKFNAEEASEEEDRAGAEIGMKVKLHFGSSSSNSLWNQTGGSALETGGTEMHESSRWW